MSLLVTRELKQEDAKNQFNKILVLRQECISHLCIPMVADTQQDDIGIDS